MQYLSNQGLSHTYFCLNYFLVISALFSRNASSYTLLHMEQLENKEALLFSVTGPIQLRFGCLIQIFGLGYPKNWF